MYKRYSSVPDGSYAGECKTGGKDAPRCGGSCGSAERERNVPGARHTHGDACAGTGGRNKPPRRPESTRVRDESKSTAGGKGVPVSPLLKFIPQSVYNPETGKVLGFLSAEDLLIAALILVLIDNRDADDDNSLLIYALVYILISDRINLPF